MNFAKFANKSPKIKQEPIHKFLNAYNLENFYKNVDTPIWREVDFQISEKFPEHIPSYLKYLKKYSEKNSDIWNKTNKKLKELEETLKKAGDLMREVSENMIEFYNQLEKLNSSTNIKDSDGGKLFIEAHKFFFDWG